MLRKKGFTLIELLVVIAIIGLLATIALSATQSARKRAADAKTKSAARSVLTAWITYSSDHDGFYTTNPGAVRNPLDTPANSILAGGVMYLLANSTSPLGKLIETGNLRAGFDGSSLTGGFDLAVTAFAAKMIGVAGLMTAKPPLSAADSIYGTSVFVNGTSLADAIQTPGSPPAGPWFTLVQK